MGIRDILMLIVGYACVPLALYDAYYGLLAYCWLSFMRPQTLVWSAGVQSARITFAVAIALIVRTLLTPWPWVRFRGPTVVFLALWAWYGVATVGSTHVDLSTGVFIDFCKIGIGVVLITGLVRTRSQLKWLIILLALCPGFYGFKLGLFFLRGAQMTAHGGPIGSDNNDTALFIAMSIPMLVFAASEVKNNWGRYGLYIVAALAVPGVIVTTSRGGILALAAAVGLTVWRKTTWWKAAIAGAVVAIGALAIIPGGTLERYHTIESYEEDPSAMSRIWAWETSVAMANARPLVGVGFGMPTYMAEYDNYKTHEEDHPHIAHSVWFSVLGEAGYVGLALYLILVLCTLWTTRHVRRLARQMKAGKDAWFRAYAVMLECTILTFAVGATFLSKVTFEYIYAIFLLSVPLAHLAEAEADNASGGKVSRLGEPGGPLLSGGARGQG